jgi:glucose/arabinose dehydrogenase
MWNTAVPGAMLSDKELIMIALGELLARGIRNTVGFDWHPKTNSLYFTENGRDMLGDDIPPDELNKWTKNHAFAYWETGHISQQH